MSNKSSLADPG